MLRNVFLSCLHPGFQRMTIMGVSIFIAGAAFAAAALENQFLTEMRQSCQR
jgi:hypothetical protein